MFGVSITNRFKKPNNFLADPSLLLSLQEGGGGGGGGGVSVGVGRGGRRPLASPALPGPKGERGRQGPAGDKGGKGEPGEKGGGVRCRNLIFF